MQRQLTPLNPIFADLPTSKLITKLEIDCVFKSAELEAELNARLERMGKRWRFVRGGKIEIYFPEKQRGRQQPCNIGLFDEDRRDQIDMADL